MAFEARSGSTQHGTLTPQTVSGSVAYLVLAVEVTTALVASETTTRPQLTLTEDAGKCGSLNSLGLSS